MRERHVRVWSGRATSSSRDNLESNDARSPGNQRIVKRSPYYAVGDHLVTESPAADILFDSSAPVLNFA
jgi:hypothetical protein